MTLPETPRVESILAVPIYVNDIGLDRFEKIKQEIYTEYPNIKKRFGKKTTWKDLVSTTIDNCDNILEECNLPNLTEMLKQNVLNFMNMLDISNSFTIHSSWFNKFKKGGNQDWHTHETLTKNYILSGVYYFDGVYGEIENSKIEFSTHFCGQDPYLTFPAIRYYNKIGGRIIIFSSSLPHRVPYYKGKRNSFSFNVQI